MAKYIKCEDAYRTLSDYYHHSTDNQHMALREALDRVPAADVVERKTGKWIFSYNGPNREYFCSECKRTIHAANLDAWSFCPNCGTQMIGGDDDV